ncbi:MAG: TonB-dependent receptor [Bdellovibrionia bacterium]
MWKKRISLIFSAYWIGVGLPLQAEETEELVLEVKAKRKLIEPAQVSSRVKLTQESIRSLPQGEQVSLSQLISSTTPGVVQGPFGSLFVRGNHGNVQYRIDGVQMPDSPSGTFSDAFSPRNIAQMEVLTGGLPAEYGERMAAVVNITTKSGYQTPGGSVELNYRSFNRVSPQFQYGGSNESGNLRYFFSAGFFRTDRGLDTPQPLSLTQKNVGGRESIHNQALGHNQFLKLDWQSDPQNKWSLTGLSQYTQFQIPNFPDRFKPTDSIFQNDQTLVYTPPDTNNNKIELNQFYQLVWKHSLAPATSLQVAPYWKFIQAKYINDPDRDLFSNHPNAVSFAQDRHIHNFGVKADYSTRLSEWNLFKVGTQFQAGYSSGSVDVIKRLRTPVSSRNQDPASGSFQNAYVQDEMRLADWAHLNAGLRFTATQFSSPGVDSSESQLQPRIGLNLLPTDSTKVHLYYGKLFIPSPMENLRLTYQQLGQAGSPIAPYDIKAEVDDYYEVGVDQQLGNSHQVSLNGYYRDSTNMLDDAQLLNTVLSQPYNYEKGFAYGVEFSVKGKLTEDLSEYFNYSYEIAKGRGIRGGMFAFQDLAQDDLPSSSYQFLDHVQIHTITSGLLYTLNQFSGSIQGVYGSGLRPEPNGISPLPANLKFDLSLSYEWSPKGLFSNSKISLDVLNLLDNAYAVTFADGFNGSSYAAGREIFVHLTKTF